MSNLLLPIIATCIGSVLSVAGLSYGMFGTSSEVTRLNSVLKDKERELVDLEQAKEKYEKQMEQLTQDIDEKKRVTEKLNEQKKTTQESYNKQIAEHKVEIEALYEKVEALKNSVSDSQEKIAAINKKKMDQGNLAKLLEANKSMMIALDIGNNELRSGFLVSNGIDRIILLTDAFGMPSKDVAFVGKFLVNNHPTPVIAKLAVNQLDESKNLASLALVNASATLRGLNLPLRVPPKVGETIYAICNIKLGDVAVEYNIFDGTITADGITENGILMYKTSLPSNKGSNGALVLGEDGLPYGMALIRTYMGTPTTFIVPNSVILNAVKKF